METSDSLEPGWLLFTNDTLFWEICWLCSRMVLLWWICGLLLDFLMKMWLSMLFWLPSSSVMMPLSRMLCFHVPLIAFMHYLPSLNLNKTLNTCELWCIPHDHVYVGPKLDRDKDVLLLADCLLILAEFSSICISPCLDFLRATPPQTPQKWVFLHFIRLWGSALLVSFLPHAATSNQQSWQR